MMMYAFCCKQRSLLYNGFALNLRNSPIWELGYDQNTRILFSPIKPFSSLAKEDDEQQQKHSFTVSYLMDSCGLSPKAALSASKRVHFESSEGPDSVLSLLRNYGFEDAHISRIIGLCPKLLSASPEKTLMPKLEFFHSIGLSNSELPKVICSSPNLLNSSLEKRLIPIYDFFKSVVGHDINVAAALRHCSWHTIGFDVQRRIIPNVEILRRLGAPQSIIVSLVTSHPTVLGRQTDQFDAKVKELVNMGFNPSKSAFVQALAAIIHMSESTWQHKIEIYKRWGWSDHEIGFAFRNNPICLRLSEMKIENVMDFLVNKMGVKSIAIARRPVVLTYSLEKRIIPRCLVVRYLQLKGLLTKDLYICTFDLSEKKFLNRYVTKYQNRVPEILGVYQGKGNLIEELGIGTEDINTKAL